MEFHSHPTFQGGSVGGGGSSVGSRTFDSSSYKSFTLLPQGQNLGGVAGFGYQEYSGLKHGIGVSNNNVSGSNLNIAAAAQELVN